MTNDDYGHDTMDLMYSPGNVPGLGADLDLFATCPAGCECRGTCDVTCPHHVEYRDLVTSDKGGMVMEAALAEQQREQRNVGIARGGCHIRN